MHVKPSVIAQHRWVLPIIALFVLRGFAIQCIYPPLEGADEYQHIAYIQYLIENQSIPVYGEAIVPKSLYGSLVANPHCQFDLKQTACLGCEDYSHFFHSKPICSTSPDIILYQAQHPPLYYLTCAPLFAWTSTYLGFRGSIYFLRFLNIFIIALALPLCLAPLKIVAPDRRIHDSAVMVVVASPMLMTYIARVSNDALAFAFISGAVYLLIRFTRSTHPGIVSLLAGLCLGFGVITKLTALVFMPAAIMFILYYAFHEKAKWRRAILGVINLSAGYLTLGLPFHLWSLKTYGVFVPAQETIRNAAAGCSMRTLLQAIDISHLKVFFFERLVLGNLWLSGWTFLSPHSVYTSLYECLIYVAFGGVLTWAFRHLRSRTHPIHVFSPALILCILIVCTTFASTYLHALHTILAYGQLLTPAYYAMIAFPAFVTCSAAAFSGYGTWTAICLLLLNYVLFVVTEIHALLFIAVPHWAATDDLSQAFDRLASVHPPFPSPKYFFFFYSIAVIGQGWFLFAAFLSVKSTGNRSPGT